MRAATRVSSRVVSYPCAYRVARTASANPTLVRRSARVWRLHSAITRVTIVQEGIHTWDR